MFVLTSWLTVSFRQHGEPDSVILCLRELSTGEPHPLARNPDIVIDPVSGDHGKLSIMLEIVGPRLLLLLTWNRGLRFLRDPEDEQDKLLLFNWWEGTMVTVSPQVSRLRFLSSNCFAVTLSMSVGDGGALDVERLRVHFS